MTWVIWIVEDFELQRRVELDLGARLRGSLVSSYEVTC
jgi:hypothetical protein